MLTITGVTYRIAGRVLLDDASAQINAGWKVGLIGRNGAGKSTLLALIRGTVQPDAGDLLMQKDLRLGFVAQEAPGGETTPLDAVLAADTERARLLAAADTEHDGMRAAEIQERLLAIDAHAAPARAASILDGLGFDHAAQHRPLSSYSGGWRMRVALAAALFPEPDLLLLDEPTNHLDLEAALWLADFLKRYRNTILLVSHDRQFLNDVATHTLHLSERRLQLYTGGYDQFLRARREHLARQQALAQQQELQRKHLQSFVDRFRAKATKASQAQSRLKALAKLEPIALASDEPSIPFDFPEAPELAPPLLTLDGVQVGYAPGKPVLRDLDLRLDPDDRIALLGANGNGKSTLAKLLAGSLDPEAGHLFRAPKLRSGFFAQHQIEALEPEQSPYDHLAALMPKAPPEQVRARLARFGFGQDKVFVKAGNLSGGEKARLNFALITHAAPPLLILDEPTNHLDIEAREALVTAINDFAGAVVLVTHDWHLLSLVADRLWLVADGTARPFNGDLEDYRKHLVEVRAAAAPQRERVELGPNKRDARRAAADRRQAQEPLRRRIRAAERLMGDLTARKSALDQVLADPATYEKSSAGVPELLRQQTDLAQQLAAAEAEWLDAAEAMEQPEE
jgi:ATP-binding cassette subfamily F protein 3